MATLFSWTLLVLCPFVARSQSGDDGEFFDLDCWSLMSLKNNSLVCDLAKEDFDNMQYAKLCDQKDPVCSNAIMENNQFSFHNLIPLIQYKLHIHLKEGQNQTQGIYLPSIVKIPSPDIENATYELDEAIIHIKYNHDYVKQPEFQVEFWKDRSNLKTRLNLTIQTIRLGEHILRDSEMCSVRVRAKPVKFFSGSWTEWSAVKTFKVNQNSVNDAEAPVALYILLCVTPLVLVVISVLIIRCKKEIQACLFPDIPDPKSTLAQIYRQQEHLPVSFSPEMFKDTNIYPVAYYEENQFTPAFGDDQGETTESCDDDVAPLKCFPTSAWDEQDEDEDQSLNSASSRMKMMLLDECASAEDVHDNPGCQSVAALQRHSNDETYVTMSSLYKTQ